MKSDFKKRLRRIGHSLNPVVMVGHQQLTESVMAETQRCLDDHELIKVKFSTEDKALRAEMIDNLLQQTGAELVQKVGKLILIYKAAAKQNAHLSNIVRFSHLSD